MAKTSDLTKEAWQRIGAVLDRVADLDAAARLHALEAACRAEGVSVAEIEPFLVALGQPEDSLAHVNPALVDRSMKALAEENGARVAVGTKVGPYEILEMLSAGGMGEVYKARDTRLNRLVAIKLMVLHLADRPEARQRFEREARAISALSHPHICTLFDVGTHDTADFLVMELIEGETLAARLQRGALPIAEAVEYATQIADALAAAHDHGIVHRDLKPANVMLTKYGVKLLDFGIAALRPASAPIDVANPALTAQGTILGTVQYMAPEQLEGGASDPRTDIFALGTILYEMLTGLRAFESDNPAAVIAAALERETSAVLSDRDGVSPALAWTVRRCLAKRPEERWQSAADVAGHLRWIGASAPRVAEERTNKRRLRIAIAATTTAIVTVAALTGSQIFLRGESEQPREEFFRYEIPAPAGTTHERLFAFSPDGRRLAFTAAEPRGRRTLWIRPLDAFASRSIPGTDGALYPFWSPDGASIGFFADDKLKKVELATGNVQVICEAGLGGGGTWNADGTILFAPQSVTGSAVLHRVSSSGGAPMPVSDLEGRAGTHAWPHFLPDGRHYLYQRIELGGLSGVFWGRLDSNEYKPLLAIPTSAVADGGLEAIANAVGRAVYADGRLFYVRAGSLFAQRFDLDRLELVAEPVRIADEIFQDGPGRAAFDVSSGGVLAYRTRVPRGLNQLTWLDRDGREIGNVADPDAYAGAALSPDGTKILTGRLHNPNDIVRIDVDRGTASPAASRGSVPTWSHDGERFAFRGGRSGVPLISIAPADGSNLEGQLLGFAANAWPGDWSSNGDRLIGTVIRAQTSSWDLFVTALAAPGDASFPVASRFDEGDPRLSPDGRWLAYAVKDDSRRWDLYVRPFDREGGAVHVSRNGGRYPRWGADGRELFYVDADGTMVRAALEVGQSFEVLDSTPLFRHPALSVGYDAGFASPYDVTKDGRRFLVNVPTKAPEAAAISVVVNWPATLNR